MDLFDGFSDMLEHHLLLHLDPDDVIHLLWTCRRAHQHCDRWLSSYIFKGPRGTCECCDELVPRRAIIWLWVEDIPSCSICCRSSSSDDEDEEEEACGGEVFQQHSIFFHVYERVVYSSRNFISLNEYGLHIREWECLGCDKKEEDRTLRKGIKLIYYSPLRRLKGEGGIANKDTDHPNQ